VAPEEAPSPFRLKGKAQHQCSKSIKGHPGRDALLLMSHLTKLRPLVQPCYNLFTMLSYFFCMIYDNTNIKGYMKPTM
jgi:hypothetical protein